jgi:hypothetical protein
MFSALSSPLERNNLGILYDTVLRAACTGKPHFNAHQRDGPDTVDLSTVNDNLLNLINCPFNPHSGLEP